MDTRLARSVSDKVFGGVCGGLARYFNIDSSIVRILFVVAVLSGLSPLIYIILWVIMPQDANYTVTSNQLPQPQAQDPTGEWKFDPYTGKQIKQ